MSYFNVSMIKIVRVLIFTFVLIPTTISFVNCKQKHNSNIILGHSTQLFAADLFTKLGDGNQLISPLVIQSGLSLLPVKGPGKNELINSLHLSNINLWTNAYKRFLSSIDMSKNIDIKSASAIYVTDKTYYLKSYKKMMKKYGTKLKSVDFSKPDIVADEVNQWVEEKTNNRISDVVDASALSSATQALLVTALYFNGDWEKQFLKEATYQGVFYSNGQEEGKMKTNMMSQTNHFNFIENTKLDAKFLELPYEDQDYTMTIVLPNKRNGIHDLEQQINKIFVKQNMTSHNVFVNLPRFKFEKKLELTSVLRSLGINSIFDEGVSFGYPNDKLEIGNIVQKTYVDVNEVGTEAAAVMEIEMVSRLGFFEVKSFVADHPFLFFVRQESSGVILFLGRFMNP